MAATVKVLFVGFGLAPRLAGGAVAIQWSMIEACRLAGLRAEIYQAGIFDLLGPMRIRSRFVNGVTVHDLVNGPMPAECNGCSVNGHALRVQDMHKRVFETSKPDVVHVHELSYHGPGVIQCALELGFPVVKTMHNYLDVCPQRDLMYNGAEPCTDFENGNKCVSCTKQMPTTSRFYHVVSQQLARTPHFRAGLRLVRDKMINVRNYQGTPIGSASDGCQTAMHHVSASDYLDRRHAYVRLLNNISAVHVYSTGCARVLEAHGINARKFQYVPVTTPTVDRLVPRAPRLAREILTFGYRGGLSTHKGIDLLIDSFASLDQRRARLIIYGDGDPRYVETLRKMSRNLNLEIRGRYEEKDLQAILSATDVGIVPSVWEEVFGLVGVEYLQAGVPIIGSRVGGITDYLKDGVTGISFNPGNSVELISALQQFVSDPAIISSFRTGMRRWITMSEMGERLHQLYRTVSA